MVVVVGAQRDSSTTEVVGAYKGPFTNDVIVLRGEGVSKSLFTTTF